MSHGTSPSIRIRTASHSDAALLAALASRTFLQTFGPANTESDVALHLERHYGEDIQRKELADARCTYLIAEVGGTAAGFAMLRSVGSPACVNGGRPIEIHRFYVDAPFHGRGVAQALMSACEGEATRLQRGTLWLGVWERNDRARRFYEKMGFREIGSQEFLLGTDPQRDLVMQRELGGS